MNRRLGCLTGGGLLAAALTLAVVLVVLLTTGGRMFSPGALNAEAGEMLGEVRSHAEIGGRCEACHAAPWSGAALSDRCLDCHQNVAEELSQGAGRHASLAGQAAALDCRGCHLEHRGATAPLTEIDPQDFPHEAMGFALSGHARMADGREFACGDCHTTTVLEFAPSTCTDCHRLLEPEYMSAHLLDFSEGCLDCHDGVDRYNRDDFDHNTLQFPLQAAHAEVACRGCHAGAQTVADLQGTPQDCIGCHREDDAHEGQFGYDCASCHNTTSWPDASFDHNQTAFPLTGKHVDVMCQDCHTDGVFQGTPQDCVACHADPIFHRGVFGLECADCHMVDGWTPATFNAPHTFPIDHGEEGLSSCRTCHPDSVAAWTCYGCHEHTPSNVQEEHDGEGLGDITDCVRCHPTGQEDEAENRGRGE